MLLRKHPVKKMLVFRSSRKKRIRNCYVEEVLEDIDATLDEWLDYVPMELTGSYCKNREVR